MKNSLSKRKLERYSRQIILKDIGILGQKKIINSKVLIVGIGGLGSPVADLLARCGVGYIGAIDHDKVDISNLQRQILYTSKDVGKFKVDIFKRRIKLINRDVKVKILKEKASEKNLNKIVKDFDIIVDGTDNFKTKFLINKFSLKYKRKLIVGAISKFDGHIFSFDFNNKSSPCLKCFYQSEPSDEVLNCDKILIIIFFTSNAISEDNEKFLMLKNDKVNVRYGPSFDYPIKYIYKKINLPVKVIDKKENFRRIIDNKKNGGWIHISQLKQSKSFITASNKILFKKPTKFSKPLAKIETGRLLLVKKCERNWCLVETKSFKGWVDEEDLWGKIN